MVLLVKKQGDKIVILNNNRKLVELEDYRALFLLRQLAKLLGYHITGGRPIVKCKQMLGIYDCTVFEGESEKRVEVLAETLTIILELLEEKCGARRPCKVKKRELGDTLCKKLGVCEDWERLFSNRDKYYSVFRVPLLLLEKHGKIKLTRQYIVLE